jgi:L-malate glycosyltransferase
MKDPSVVIIAASLEILGGHGVQAGALVEALGREGVRVRFIPINPSFPATLRWTRRIPYLRTVLNQMLFLPRLAGIGRADVVHVFSASYWSFVLAPLPAILAGRAFGKRVVLHYHSGEAADHLARWGGLVHPWLRLADEIVVPSEFLRGVFAEYGYRTRVIPNVVDAARFRYRERSPLRPRLLSTRSLEQDYRVNNTIEAFALLKGQYPDATLIVAGRGSQETPLRQLAASLGVDGIRFAGGVAPSDIVGLYEDADILVNSSVVDNQPVSILEAFAAGLPVVSTGPGDIPAMLAHGGAGLLVPSDDPAAMAKALATLLDDPDSARARARRARLELDRFTWPGVRAAWRAVYGAPAVGPGVRA